MEDATEQRQASVRERIGRRAWVRSVALVGSGLVAGGILAGTLTAVAADDERSTSDSSTSQEEGARGDGHGGPRGNGDPSQPQRDDEELLTGDTATQVTEAALTEYPDATIERVETDSDGVYEAHLVTADGERVTVELDEDFSITGTESRD